MKNGRLQEFHSLLSTPQASRALLPQPICEARSKCGCILDRLSNRTGQFRGDEVPRAGNRKHTKWHSGAEYDPITATVTTRRQCVNASSCLPVLPAIPEVPWPLQVHGRRSVDGELAGGTDSKQAIDADFILSKAKWKTWWCLSRLVSVGQLSTAKCLPRDPIPRQNATLSSLPTPAPGLPDEPKCPAYRIGQPPLPRCRYR